MREELVGSFDGVGELRADGLPALAVSYRLRMYEPRVKVLDEVVARLTRTEGQIRPTEGGDLFSYMQAGSCELRLADGKRLVVFLKSLGGGSDWVPIGISEGAKRLRRG